MHAYRQTDSQTEDKQTEINRQTKSEREGGGRRRGRGRE